MASWAPKGGVTATLGSVGTFSFFYWGFIFLIIFSTSIWGIGQSIRNEQLQGTIEQLFLAPISRVSVISGRFARTMITDLAIIIYTTVLLAGLSHGTVTVQNPLLLLTVYGLLQIAVFGFGLVFAAITFRLKSFSLLSNLAQFTVIGLCGLFFPLRILPLPILAVSMAIPFTYFADMFRYAGYGGATLLDPALEMVVALERLLCKAEAGALLPGPDATLARPTFEEWLDAAFSIDSSSSLPRTHRGGGSTSRAGHPRRVP